MIPRPLSPPDPFCPECFERHAPPMCEAHPNDIVPEGYFDALGKVLDGSHVTEAYAKGYAAALEAVADSIGVFVCCPECVIKVRHRIHKLREQAPKGTP